MSRHFDPTTLPPPGALETVVAWQVGTELDRTLAETIDGQCEWGFCNILGMLVAADIEPQNIARLITYVTDRNFGQAFVDARTRVLGEVKSPNTFLVVAGLGQPDWLIQIEATSARSP